MKKAPKSKYPLRLEPVDGGGPRSFSHSLMDEADTLFPGLKQPPSEPKLHPPTEYLGRNPYSELKRRAEHLTHLQAIDSETQQKIKETQELLAARRTAQDAITNPLPMQLSDEERLQHGGLLFAISAAHRPAAALPPLRSAPPASNHRAELLENPTTAIVTSPTGTGPSLSSYWSSSGVSQCAGASLWSLSSGVQPRPPTISARDAKASKSQMSKHKNEKHTGYFGEELLDASARRIRDEVDRLEEEGDTRVGKGVTGTSPLSFLGRILTFTEPVERLLALHPSTASIDVCSNVSWTLDAFAVVDAVGLELMFGKPSIPMTRVNAQLTRNSDACPKGNPAVDPPAFLPSLRASINGKPSAYWPGDVVTAELYLSRYAYTCKYARVSSSCRAYPNVFAQFGVNGEALERVSPFPLRFLPGATSTAAQDVKELSLSYLAKTQSRVLRAVFLMPMFQGFVPAEATLSVSGSASSGEIGGGAIIITAELDLSVPDHVTNFNFRGAAAQLAFFDALDGTQRAFRVVQQQMPAAASSSHPCAGRSDSPSSPEAEEDQGGHEHHRGGAAPPPLASRIEISFLWNLSTVPLMLKLFDQDPTLAMSGRLAQGSSQQIVLRSSSPSERCCTLWNFVKLKELVAFVECAEGVTVYGVECTAEVTVSSGGPTSEKATLLFKGRLSAEMLESKKALMSPATLKSNVASPSTHFTFQGSMQDNAWNYVGGATFLFLKEPKLSFCVDATTLLPRDVRIIGTPVIQMADEGVGFSSEHSFTFLEPDCGVVVFPVDSLPNYVLRAPISRGVGMHHQTAGGTAAGSTTTTTTTSLKDIVLPLLHPDALLLATTLSHEDGSEGLPAEHHQERRNHRSHYIETLVGVLNAADRVHLHESSIVINDSSDELTVSPAQQFQQGGGGHLSSFLDHSCPRYSPGMRIMVDSATVWVHGVPCSASGVIHIEGQTVTDDGYTGDVNDGAHRAVRLDAQLQIRAPLFGAHRGGGTVGSDAVAGVGPLWRLQLTIPSTPPPSPDAESFTSLSLSDGDDGEAPKAITAVGVWVTALSQSLHDGPPLVDCALEKAVVSLRGAGNALPLAHYRLTFGSGAVPGGCETMQHGTISALCVPPRVILEHRAEAACHSASSLRCSSRSINSALSAFYDIQLSMKSSAGSYVTIPKNLMQHVAAPSQPCGDLSPPAWDVVSSNTMQMLKCGVFEALRDALCGKVAEYRVLCQQQLDRWNQICASTTDNIEQLEREISLRVSIVRRLDVDAASLCQSGALSNAVAEQSTLARYWHARVVGNMRLDAELAAQDDMEVCMRQATHHAVIETWRQMEGGSASDAQKHLLFARYACSSSAVSLLAASLERALSVGVERVIGDYKRTHLAAYTNNVSPPFPKHHHHHHHHHHPSQSDDDIIAAGNATLLTYLQRVHMPHLLNSQKYAENMILAFTTIIQQLEADEVVFPSLFVLHDVSIQGGQRNRNSSCSSSPLNLSLVAGGVLRGRMFRCHAPLAALDQTCVVAAVDSLSSDMLRTYLSLLRFQQ